MPASPASLARSKGRKTLCTLTENKWKVKIRRQMIDDKICALGEDGGESLLYYAVNDIMRVFITL